MKVLEAQLIVGYKGFIELARRSGQVVSLHADVHYADDELWEYEYGSNMVLRHKPGNLEGEKLHAYCHVKLKDGEAFVVLPWAKVMELRSKSPSWNFQRKSSPWATNEDEMAAKSAVRYLANRGGLPMSTDFMRALEIDGERRDFAGLAISPPTDRDFTPDRYDDEYDDESEPEVDEDGVVRGEPVKGATGGSQDNGQPQQKAITQSTEQDVLQMPDFLRRNKQPDPVTVDHGPLGDDPPPPEGFEFGGEEG